MQHDEQIERGLGPDPDTVHAVLVVLPGGLGTVLKGVPALRHLRHLYPHARLQVAAEEWAADLLAGCPFVDGCLPLEKPGELLLSRFDVAVSLADPKVEPVLLSGFGALQARVHAAYRLDDERNRYSVHPVRLHRSTAAARMLHLAWLLGGDRLSGELALWPRLADRNEAAALLEPVGDRPVVVLHQGATDERRRWHADGFARVADVVHDRGLTPVLVGLEADREGNARLAAAARVPVLDLTGQTSVGVLAGILERTALFVGVDSGPAVLAGALGTRSLVIGPGCPVEPTGPITTTRYLTADVTPPAPDRLPDAATVPAEAVVAAVTLAGHQAARSWRDARIAS